MTIDVNALQALQAADCPSIETESGLKAIRPEATIAGAGEYYQPGMVPIGLCQLLQLTNLSGPDFDRLKILDDLKLFGELQESKSLGRRNERNAPVYDLWGLLNPENYLVLATLTAGILSHTKSKGRSCRALFLGTGSGYPEVRLLKLAHRMGALLEVTTVDFRKDSESGRETTQVAVPLDDRNLAYGPLPDQGIGCAIREALSTSPEGVEGRVEFVFEDSAVFLSRCERETYDLIVVDANHLFDAVRLDLVLGWPALVRGGVMFMDDFGGTKLATNGGVTAAAYCHAAETRQYGYFVSNPTDVVQTNAAFFIKSAATAAGPMPSLLGSI